MKVRFWKQDDCALGEVKYTDFNEVLIPYHDENAAETFIIKSFSGDGNISWKVEGIQFAESEIDISLAEVKHTDSIGLMASKGSSSPNKIVTRFNIVEVDFGHKVSAIDSQGQLGQSVLCSASHLPSELYKKRPCIVLSVNGDRIQVMPLTTSPNSGDPESMEVSKESFAKLHAKYTERTCRTLPRMIQTVSSYRVYPPMLKGNSFPVTCFAFKLCSDDKAEMKLRLARHYGSDVVADFEALKQSHSQLKHERGALLTTKEDLRDAKKGLEDRMTRLLEIIGEVSKQYGLEGDPEDALKALLD